MKPKTTLNLFKNFLAIELKKVSQGSQMLLFLFLLLLSNSTSNAQSNSCKATLQVEKNRFTKSVPPEGVSYSLQISNIGTSNSIYTLSATNTNSNCSNKDGSSSAGNVNLSITLTDTNSIPINQISVNPGETITFLAQVKVPNGTTINRWNCSQINATATECPSYSVSTTLHTMVSDPSAE
ncbi:hypothetical protein [Flavobacterium granuli]|uniref:Uncharacterized protein n=1 Tax=Flavobacterium granuli TaxID=280093 RepID=A0ABU1S043_9FLAO|nr:hypothetical protein [Flavobacterium granuli]MDR6844403.1 hypothetical protein [Flavobacterium granuli]